MRGAVAATRLIAAGLTVLATTAGAQAMAPVSAPARLCAGTLLDIELVDAVSSRNAKRGDLFPIRLAAPVQADGGAVLPAGLAGQGQVIDAAPAGPLGRPAKLLLAARYIEFNGVHIPLKAFRLGGRGTDTGMINVVGVIVPVAAPVLWLVPGGEYQVPAGAHGQAKIAASTDVPTPVPAAPSTLSKPEENRGNPCP